MSNLSTSTPVSMPCGVISFCLFLDLPSEPVSSLFPGGEVTISVERSGRFLPTSASSPKVSGQGGSGGRRVLGVSDGGNTSAGFPHGRGRGDEIDPKGLQDHSKKGFIMVYLDFAVQNPSSSNGSWKPR